MTTKTKLKITKLVKSLFKLKGEPYPITPLECGIFEAVTNKNRKWVWISAPTRYGKTEIIALALIYLAVFLHLKIVIVAGSSEKADKIMEYILIHISDNPVLYQGLINLQILENIDKLKVKASKQELIWATGVIRPDLPVVQTIASTIDSRFSLSNFRAI